MMSYEFLGAIYLDFRTVIIIDKLERIQGINNFSMRIYGAVRMGEIWRRRKNRQLDALFAYLDIVTFIQLGRLGVWIWRVARTKS